MSHSSASRLWPVEVDEEVAAVAAPIWESFSGAGKYVQEMWCRVAEAQGALNYHGTDIDLHPVIDLLQFVQNAIFNQGLVVRGAAQKAVYDAWWEGEDLRRERRRSIAGMALVAHDPEVAHVP